MYMNNNQNEPMNNMLNSKLFDMLKTIDKNKLEQVSKMVQNMSKEDLNNLVSMLNKNQQSNANNNN